MPQHDFHLAAGVNRERWDELVRFGREELTGRYDELEWVWRRSAELGIQGLTVPEAYGGRGAPLTTLTATLQALGYGCRHPGVVFALGAQICACQLPIARFGSVVQRARYLPALGAGKIVAAHAMTEPNSGSDAFSLATTAAANDRGFVLRGSKAFVTNAPTADVFILFATVNRARGFAGVCAFLIDRSTRGLSVGPPVKTVGVESVPMAEVWLDDCQIPSEALLGRPGAGMAIFNWTMDRERSILLAPLLGAMRRNLETCKSALKERATSGSRSLIDRIQADMVVGMKMRGDIAGWWLYRAASLLDAGDLASVDAALTKLYVSEVCARASAEAVQICGLPAAGDGPLVATMYASMAGRVYSGTSELLRDVVGRSLGL